MNDEQYSLFWEQESLLFERQGIYRELLQTVPAGDVIEIGCGAGISTFYLADDRRVLAIDNNAHLMEKAKRLMMESGANVQFLQTNLLSLSQGDVDTIREFFPKGIICWFMGSNPANVNPHTEGLPLNEQGKRYREKIEDVVVSKKLCSQSVEWIHLVNRAGIIESATHGKSLRRSGTTTIPTFSIQ